jgi:hypothetical protein
LIGKVNLCPYSRENLDGIGMGNVGGKLEPAADFEHGENVRKREAIGKPNASRCGVSKLAGKSGGTVLFRAVRGKLAGEIAGAVRGLKGNANASQFITGSSGFQHGLTSVIARLSAWNTCSIWKL